MQYNLSVCLTGEILGTKQLSSNAVTTVYFFVWKFISMFLNHLKH